MKCLRIVIKKVQLYFRRERICTFWEGKVRVERRVNRKETFQLGTIFVNFIK